MHTRKLIVGIDEAGRGPVIGPMAICAVGVNTMRSPLFQLPLKDSKKLTRKGREVLFYPVLAEAAQVLVHLIPPAEIDKVSLTEIWFEFVLHAAKALPARKLLLDAPVSQRALHAAKQSLLFRLRKQRTTCRVALEHKADENYPLVSAASIIAKVVRDGVILHLHSLYGDFGSGYPSDPKTRAWVREHRRHPIVRQKWKLNL